MQLAWQCYISTRTSHKIGIIGYRCKLTPARYAMKIVALLWREDSNGLVHVIIVHTARQSVTIKA